MRPFAKLIWTLVTYLGVIALHAVVDDAVRQQLPAVSDARRQRARAASHVGRGGRKAGRNPAHDGGRAACHVLLASVATT